MGTGVRVEVLAKPELRLRLGSGVETGAETAVEAGEGTVVEGEAEAGDTARAGLQLVTAVTVGIGRGVGNAINDSVESLECERRVKRRARVWTSIDEYGSRHSRDISNNDALVSGQNEWAL